MPVRIDIAGPLAVSFENGRPLPWILSGAVRDGAGERVLISLDCAPDVRLPQGLRDVRLEIADDGAGTLRILTGGTDHAFPVQRAVVHHDVSAPVRDVIPPRAISLVYRLRWLLGIWLARLPLPRAWLNRE